MLSRKRNVKHSFRQQPVMGLMDAQVWRRTFLSASRWPRALGLKFAPLRNVSHR